MENKLFGDNNNLPTHSWGKWKIALLITIIVVVFSSLVFGLVFGYVKYYQNRVYPGVYVGDFHLGGMSANELKSFAETLNNRLSKEGVIINVSNDKVKNQNVKLDTILVEGDSTVELIALDSDRFAQLALAVGRDHSRWYNRPLDPFLIRLFSNHLLMPVNFSEDKLKEVLSDQLVSFEDSPHNAGVKITNLNSGAYDVTSEKSGQMFDWSVVLDQIRFQLSNKDC